MKTWQLTPKGHSIEITNSAFRETLTVDAELQDDSRGLHFCSRLSGRIRSGDGAGEVIKGLVGGFWSVGCVVFIDDVEVFRSQA